MSPELSYYFLGGDIDVIMLASSCATSEDHNNDFTPQLSNSSISSFFDISSYQSS